MAEPAKLTPPAVAPRKSSAPASDPKPPGQHSSGKKAPPPPPSSRSESSLAPAIPPNDDFEAPPPPIDEEAAPSPPPQTDEEVVAEAVANISMGDVENSATFKPFEALFEDESDNSSLDLNDTGNGIGMESIDIAQQLRDQEVNEPSIDDL